MRAEPRVLMTADAIGGVWPYVVDLSRGLISRGAAVDVAVMGPPPSQAQREEAAAAGVAVFDAPYRLEWMDDPWDDVDRAAEWLLALARARRPDVVQVNGYCHAALPWTAPAIVVGHSCVRSWWRAVHGQEAPPRLEEYRRRMSRGLRAAAAVVAPSAAMLAELEADHGPFADARVVPNGRAWTPRSAVARQPIVFAAGRLWDAAKNLETLSRAAARVSWPVVVAGENRGPDGSAIVADTVRFLGPLDSAGMDEWYARASIYALPARYEPFGLSILEAARAGCALVLGDIRSLRENWDGAAAFVPCDDAGALASAIQGLIDDEPRRRRLSALAQARAARFSVDRMVRGYTAVYRSVTGRARVRAAAPARAAGLAAGLVS